MSAWSRSHKKEFETPKFIKPPVELTINIETPPKTVQVKGKYGERTMYVVEDQKLGNIYLSPKQFIIVSGSIGDLTKGYQHVTLE